MRPHHLPHQARNRLLVGSLVAVLYPVVVIIMAIKLTRLGIALLISADWTEEEETLLRKAIRYGYRPEELVFTFWRRSQEIDAKAKELGLLQPVSRARKKH